jgi:hypothetical protein
LDAWKEDDCEHCMWKAPRPFYFRLLQFHIGEHSRKNVAFSSRMHRVVDVLMLEFKELRTPKERIEVVNDVCNALAIRPWQYYSSPRYDSSEDMLRGATSTAFVVALITPYPAVIERMLSAVPAPYITAEECDFGAPVRVMIALGRTAQVQQLLSNMDDKTSLSWISARRAIAMAAARGHADMVELVLQDIQRVSSYGDIMDSALAAMEAAAANQQWRIVRLLLDDYAIQRGDRTWDFALHSISCWAARYGRDDLVLCATGELYFWNRFPLREAALGAQLRTCELLIQKGAISYGDDGSRTESLARYVAKGGSVDIYHLLKQQKLWEPWHEIHFLPIAAELGHLEFAKLAVQNGCDQKPRQKRRTLSIRNSQREMKYPDDIRHFALCRAIVSGHLDLVRWLVCEVGVPIHKETDIEQLQLLPMELAVCTKRGEMIKMLEELHADPIQDGNSLDLYERRKQITKRMSNYRDALCLRTDYKMW